MISDIEVLKTEALDPIDTALALDSASQAELIVSLEQYIIDEDAAHMKRTAQAREILAKTSAELARRIRAEHADAEADEAASRVYKLAHPDLKIELHVTRRLDKRISELRALYDVLPASELKDVIFQEAPPKPEDLPWKADARKLKKLAREYQGDVAKIVDRGLVYVEQSARLVVTARDPEQNVTPEALAS